MSSKALVIDSRFKSYLKPVGHLKWEQDMHYERHQRGLKDAKTVIDDKSPDHSHCKLLIKRRAELHEERLNRIEKQNLQLLNRLRAIRIKKKPEFCFRARKALTRGDAHKLKPPTGQIPFRYDWQSLRGAQSRNSLRVQEGILNRTIRENLAAPEETDRLKRFLAKNSGYPCPLEKLDYSKAKSVRFPQSEVLVDEIDPTVEQISQTTAAQSVPDVEEEWSPFAETH